jgi:antitoxin component of MazEF toxin-antitoxin module
MRYVNTTKLRKSGNSHVITIPSEVRDIMGGIVEGQQLVIDASGETKEIKITVG